MAASIRYSAFAILAALLIQLQAASAIDVSLKTPLCRFFVSYDGDVTCRAGAEFAIPYAPGCTFEIGHDFKIAPEYSYLVFRSRRTGRDTVFKVPQSSRVEVLAPEDIVINKGAKIITVSPHPERKKCFIIELGDALEEKVDIRLHIDDGSELYRLDLGFLRKYLVIDSEGNIHTTHRIVGDSTWPVDSLEFIAIVESFSTAGKCDLLFVHKSGIDRPIGHITDVSNDHGEVEQFANVVRRVSAQSEGNRLSVTNQVSRVEIGSNRYLLLLDNRAVVSNEHDTLRIAHLKDGAEINIGKGSDPLTKQFTVLGLSSPDAEQTIQTEMDNDVDLTDFISSIQHQHPNVAVTDTSRSPLVGWLICFGLPALAIATVLGRVW